jgi:hypothetical protein
MPNYTEAACDACPHKCRAGIYVTGDVTNALVCATRNGTPDWKQTDRQANVQPSFVRVPASSGVTFVPAGETVLLGCQGCGPGAPCLLEITGPFGDRLGCVLGIERPPYRICTWYRVK